MKPLRVYMVEYLYSIRNEALEFCNAFERKEEFEFCNGSFILREEEFCIMPFERITSL